MVEEFGIGLLVGQTYYSRAIFSVLPDHPTGRRRPRAGTVARPVNARLYRAGWLAVLVPLLLAAFTIDRPGPLPRDPAALQPSFDPNVALAAAEELAERYPDRSPGSPRAPGAARWVRERLEELGLRVETDRFSAHIPGRGVVDMSNVVGVVPGRSRDTIAIVAHRDSTKDQAGANDNASGTAALLELARAYASTRTGAAGGISPRHTLIFLSTEGGAYGLLGARHFARRSPHAERVVAAINLDGIGARGRPRIELAGAGPRSPSPLLVATVSDRIAAEVGRAPERPSVLGQLLDLGFPFSLHDQYALLGGGIPAATVTTSAVENAALDRVRLGQTGRATESVLTSLDAAIELTRDTGSYVYAGGRIVHGWAIALFYIGLMVPFALALVDLLVRLRRRVSLRPALRSYFRRLAFWLWAGALFLLFGLAGAWPDGVAAPLSPNSEAAGHWPRLALALYSLVLLASWFVVRKRLVRRGQVTREQDLAGQAVALGALLVVMLVLIGTNPYALLFALPSAHAWLWLPQVRERNAAVRGLVYGAGLAGPVLLLGSFATRFGLGLDAPWYLAELTAIGYVPVMELLLFLAWCAVAAQVLAAASGRYAPYPAPAERPARGAIGDIVAAVRSRRAHGRAGPPATKGPGAP